MTAASYGDAEVARVLTEAGVHHLISRGADPGQPDVSG